MTNVGRLCTTHVLRNIWSFGPTCVLQSRLTCVRRLCQTQFAMCDPCRTTLYDTCRVRHYVRLSPSAPWYFSFPSGYFMSHKCENQWFWFHVFHILFFFWTRPFSPAIQRCLDMFLTKIYNATVWKGEYGFTAMECRKFNVFLARHSQSTVWVSLSDKYVFLITTILSKQCPTKENNLVLPFYVLLQFKSNFFSTIEVKIQSESFMSKCQKINQFLPKFISLRPVHFCQEDICHIFLCLGMKEGLTLADQTS